MRLPKEGGARSVPVLDEKMKDYEKFSYGNGQKFAQGTKRLHLILSILLLIIATPVSVLPKEAFDMILNSKLYSYPPYSFKAHFRHSLQVKVIVDNRPHYERVSKSDSSNCMDNSSWSDPVPVMVEKVLERELLLSNLFDSVSRHDKRSTLLLEIDLNSFSAAWKRGRSGLKPTFTIYGTTDLNVSLISRREKKILLIKNYREGTESKITQFRKKEDHAAIEVGKALKRVAVSLVEDIKHRLENVKTEPIKVKKGPTSVKKRSQKKQRTTKTPNKGAIPPKGPDRIVLEPIGPK
jgi:ABC-type uncharacterized transport system auxiliary subunit